MDAHTWLTKELKPIFDGTKQQYYDRLQVFYEHLNELDSRAFEHANIVKSLLVNQAGIEGLTSVCESLAVTVAKTANSSLLAESIIRDLKGQDVTLSEQTKKQLNDYKYQLSIALAFRNHRDELAYKMLFLYAYNACIEALNNIVDVPELLKFKIRRIDTHTPLNWKQATFEDIDKYFDSPQCGFLLEDYMAFFNVFIEWSLKQERFDFLHRNVFLFQSPQQAEQRDPDGTLPFYKSMPFEDYRPTEELIKLYESLFKKNKDYKFGELIEDVHLECLSKQNLAYEIQTDNGKQYIPVFIITA